MYFKPKDYDSVSVGNFRTLPADGYICRIIKAEETESSQGKPMLKIAFDICDGEYANYFMDLFQSRRKAAKTDADKKKVKWPFNGTKWIMMLDNEGKTSRNFKGFCTALEDSGTQVWAEDNSLNTAELKDAEVGVIFRREEQEYEGKKSWRTVPWGFRSVETIEGGDFYVPEDEPFKAKPTTPYANNSYNSLKAINDMQMVDSFSAAEDDIPFK